MTTNPKEQKELWHCIYWYPSNQTVATAPSEYDMVAHHEGNEIVFQSTTNEEGSSMFIRLTIDGDIARGAWYETTSPKGEFKGAQYDGVGQLSIMESGNFKGKWVGAGYDHKLDQTRIYDGDWEISRVIHK